MTLAATELLRSADRIFALTGAGMSTESGIPDFRGPGGLYERNPAAMRMFDLDAYLTDPQLRRDSWQMRRNSPIMQATPNQGHNALVDLAALRDLRIATQNIDGLHQRAGSTGVLELHGTFWESKCLDCGRRRPIQVTFARLDAGDPDPACSDCGGILRIATIAFGQALDASVLAAAVTAARECDVALAIGSSLLVQPAASLLDEAVWSGASLVILNADPTPFDDIAALRISGPIGPTLQRLVASMGGAP